jgi:hypothetical protein
MEHIKTFLAGLPVMLVIIGLVAVVATYPYLAVAVLVTGLVLVATYFFGASIRNA